MFETKMFQVRDEGTHIPVMATLIVSSIEDRVTLRAGFGIGSRYILLINLNSNAAEHDPFNWKDKRTMFNAHRYIERDFAILPNNGVVDVEYYLGERESPKEPE